MKVINMFLWKSILIVVFCLLSVSCFLVLPTFLQSKGELFKCINLIIGYLMCQAAKLGAYLGPWFSLICVWQKVSVLLNAADGSWKAGVDNETVLS